MGVEDFAITAFKTRSVKDAYEMSTFAASRMFMGMNEAFSAAFQVLNTGKPTLTSLGMKEGLDPQSLQNAKQIQRREDQVCEGQPQRSVVYECSLMVPRQPQSQR